MERNTDEIEPFESPVKGVNKYIRRTQDSLPKCRDKGTLFLLSHCPWVDGPEGVSAERPGPYLEILWSQMIRGSSRAVYPGCKE